MANNKELASTLLIDGEEYDVTAKKVANKLTIKTTQNGVEEIKEFDGSSPVEITVNSTAGSGTGGSADIAERAKTIRVTIDDGSVVKDEYAAITISVKDPVTDTGALGDIWFKYSI